MPNSRCYSRRPVWLGVSFPYIRRWRVQFPIRFWIWSPVGCTQEVATHRCFSPSLSNPFLNANFPGNHEAV